MTRQPPNAHGKQKVDFWESLTGTKMAQDDPRVHRFYRQVGCVFNHKNFFGNVQADDRVVNTDWDLEDKYMWKGMNPAQIHALTPSPAIGSLMPSTGIDVMEEEKLLESIIKDKIAGVRRNDHNMGTEYDS